VNTCLAAAAGGMAAIFASWIISSKPDLSMALNGILAGLVGITAPADAVLPLASVAIGLIAGVLVVFSVLFFDKIRVDDPVGAVSVHLTCGIWGTLAVGIFSSDYSLGTQVVGVLSYGVFTFACAMAIFLIIRTTMGLRVSEEEELEGLDYGEHGMHAYDFPAASGMLDGLSSPRAAAEGPAPATTLAESRS